MRGVAFWSIALSIVAASGVYALSKEWAATYGTPSGEWCETIFPTVDGTFIVGGNAVDPAGGTGRMDVLLIEVSSAGRILRQRIYDGEGSLLVRCGQQTSDGGVFLSGIFRDSVYAEDMEVWAMKLDSDHRIEWDRIYGGEDWDRTYACAQAPDGGYVLAGCTRSFTDSPMHEDFWVLRLDADGDVLWERTYGGERTDRGLALALTDDGGCVVAGCTASFGARGNDFWLLKLDDEGDVEWGRAYGGSVSEIAYSVEQTSDGGYILAGITGSYGAGTDDALLLRLDPHGEIVWARAYGGPATDFAVNVRETESGFVFTGHTASFGSGNRDVWILHLGPDGEILWERTFGGALDEAGNSIHSVPDGYIVAGYSWSFSKGEDDILLLTIGLDGTASPACGPLRPSSSVCTTLVLDPISTDVVVRDTCARCRSNESRSDGCSIVPDFLCPSG